MISVSPCAAAATADAANALRMVRACAASPTAPVGKAAAVRAAAPCRALLMSHRLRQWSGRDGAETAAVVATGRAISVPGTLPH